MSFESVPKEKLRSAIRSEIGVCSLSKHVSDLVEKACSRGAALLGSNAPIISPSLHYNSLWQTLVKAPSQP